jgi:hypothetical protein
VPNADTYIDGISLNVMYPKNALLTEKEQESTPYPDHLQIRAHAQLELKEELTEGMYGWGINDYGLPAKVLERFVNSTEQYYDLLVGIIPKEAKVAREIRDREANVTWVHRGKVPRNAIGFFDKPGRTDMHLPNAFRHVIGIPNDIFPENWKNANQIAERMQKEAREADKSF